jgi:hypothetical protein
MWLMNFIYLLLTVFGTRGRSSTIDGKAKTAPGGNQSGKIFRLKARVFLV